ncbi:MAG TPA: alpha/beta hydrolase [Devosia sp.]
MQQASSTSPVHRIARWFALCGLYSVTALASAALLFLVASIFSPWPGAMLVRVIFEFGGLRTAALLRPHVPDDVSAIRDVSYDPADPDARLDVYFPSRLGDGELLPAIVWIHGGAWVSGGRWQMAEYASILASGGYAVVVVGYSLAPEATYPTPLLQVSRALDFLAAEGTPLHVDNSRLVLAGDSAGAQISAQIANAVTSPDYARLIGVDVPPVRLRAVALFSGAYDLDLVNFGGPMGLLLRSVLWAYTGVPNFQTDPRFEPASVVRFVTLRFPPTFISAGHEDPLLTHSIHMAEALADAGVRVERLFFGVDGPTGHNYQFDLDSSQGQQALSRLLAFMEAVFRPSAG